MPKQKDLKRLIRSRMQKTGESYTTARAQLLRQNETAAAATPAVVPAAATEPRNHAERAGMSEDAVRKATGRTWGEWVEILDAIDATSLPHREIARHVEEDHDVGSWGRLVALGKVVS